MIPWTTDLVEQRLREAAETLRRLPAVRGRGFFSVWPQILHEADDRRDWEMGRYRPGPPSARAITRMEETLLWFRWLTPDESRLIWLRAGNVPWKRIAWRMGCDRTTAWRLFGRAIVKIAAQLNAGRVRHDEGQVRKDPQDHERI